MLISFAWTSPAFLAGRKRVTRRDYDDAYMARFRPGMIVDAWDKSPRAKGKKIGEIRIVSVRRETIAHVIADPVYMRAEWLAEGGEYLAATPERLFGEWEPATKHPSGGWVRIEFERVDA